jgi:hypothetical protein
MSVEDSKAGSIGTCPECGQKFKIPGTSPAANQPKSKPVNAKAPGKQPAAKGAPAKPPVPPRPSRPKYDWEEEDSSPYDVAEQDEPTEAAKLVARDSFRDKEYERLRKKKERELQLEDRKQNVAFLGTMLLLWIALSLATYFLQDYFYVPLGIAALLAVIGQLWLIVVAFKHSTQDGLLVLFVPLYNLVFAIKHFGAAGKPLILSIAGSLIAGTVLGVAIGSMGSDKFEQKINDLKEGKFSIQPAPQQLLVQNRFSHESPL